jgi:hypothetical protein
MLFRSAIPASFLLLSSLGEASTLIIPFAMTAPEYGVAAGVKARARGFFAGPGYGDLTAMGSTRSQYTLKASGLRDSLAGCWRVGGSVQAGVFPELYSGPGSPGREDSLARFTPTYACAKLYAGRRFASGLRTDLGLRMDVRSIVLDDTFGGLSNPSSLNAAHGARNLRLTWEGEWNRLDHDEDPRHGAALLSHAESSLPGSDQAWTSGLLSGSVTATPWEPGPTVAFRLRDERVWGTVPFWELPYAGSGDVLRGVPDHMVRGRIVQSAGMEVRQPFTLFAFRWQIAAFGELARASDNGLAVWSTSPTLAFGGGGRLLLDERHAVLRGDIGWNTGPDAALLPSIYIDFGQAF